jgi:polar amino acid transport system substrate-binding protein
VTRTRLVSVAVAAAALVALAGCTSGTAGTTTPKAPAASPAPASPAPVDDSCQPRKSLAPTGALPAAGKMPSGSFMAAIQKRGRLILGTSQDTLLFSSRNAFTGQVEGFDVDMGRQIAKAIFGDPNKLQIKVIGYDQRISSLADGSVDLVADTMTINCERWKQVNFSSVYFDAGQRVLVSTNSKATNIVQLGGQKVCAAVGSTSLANIAKVVSNPPPVPVGLPAFADCLVAFQRNEVAAISTDDTILYGLAAQDPYAKVVGDRFTQEPYGMAMAQTHPEFTRFVNAVLQQERTDGTWTATYDKWLSDFGKAPVPPKAEYK